MYVYLYMNFSDAIAVQENIRGLSSDYHHRHRFNSAYGSIYRSRDSRGKGARPSQ